MFEKSKLKPIFIFSVVIIAFLITLEIFLNLKFFKKDIKLGLDLQGGSHLLLEVDTKYYFKEQLNNDLDMLKSEFRQNRVKALPKIVGNEIVVLFKNKKYLPEIKKIVEENLEGFKFTEKEGQLVLSYKQNTEGVLKRRLMRQSMEIIS